MPSFDKALDAITALREALSAPEPEPVAWKHDCAALCTNDVELWIDACPHCGKPRTAPPAAPAPVVPLQGGMDNNELLAAWQKKLPGRTPEGQELSAFAVGTEVGFEHAQRLERMDWDRVHHVLAKHGKHPGRTDDHLADVIDKALSAAPPAAPAVPLTDEQIRSMWLSSEFRGNGGQADWFCEGIRAAEAHHGITGASK